MKGSISFHFECTDADQAFEYRRAMVEASKWAGITVRVLEVHLENWPDEETTSTQG